MNILIRELGKLAKFSEYISSISEKLSPIVVSGLSSVGKIQLIEATKEYSNKNICIITYNEIQAKKIAEDLKYFTNNVIFFPKREITYYDYVAESKDLPYERIDALNKIFEHEKIEMKSKNLKPEDRIIVVTTIEALMQKMISKQEIYNNVLELSVGKAFNLEDLKQDLVKLGYERAEIVDGKGQFCVRGGIVDIGNTKTQGIRIEFWGDEIDSIRSFSIRLTYFIRKVLCCNFMVVNFTRRAINFSKIYSICRIKDLSKFICKGDCSCKCMRLENGYNFTIWIFLTRCINRCFDFGRMMCEIINNDCFANFFLCKSAFYTRESQQMISNIIHIQAKLMCYTNYR